ncbi:MAG: DMT family transporter [Thermoanaerobacteraceae bacterium]|nr:DMT family transporter [Thermoanaerobacteraceae bacterium]
MKASPDKVILDNPQDKRFRQIGYAEVILACLLFGGNTIAGRIVATQVPPLALSAVRAALGLLVIAPFLWRLGPVERPRGKDLWWLALQGLVSIGLAYSTFAWGIRLSPAINAAIIFASFPAVTLVLLGIFWRHRPTFLQLVGVVIAFLGLLVVASRGSLERLFSVSFTVADGFLLLNVVVVSLGNILGQRLMERYPPIIVSAYTLFFGILWLLPWGIWEVTRQGWYLSWPGWIFLLYMGCSVSGLAVLLNFEAVHRIGSGAVGIFNNLNPLFAIALAALFLKEPLYLYHGTGVILVLGGVALSLTSNGQVSQSPSLRSEDGHARAFSR